MRAISYRGELVAVATRSRVYLAPAVSALPRGHPKLRFVAAMCVYSHDVDQEIVPGPYSDCYAELYARCLLIPDDEFELHAGWSDEALAWRFGVPLEQVVAKRSDVEIHRAARAAAHKEGGQVCRHGTHKGWKDRDGRTNGRHQSDSADGRVDP